MINLLLPHGSKRRHLIADKVTRFRRNRKFVYHKKQYNIQRHDYYRTSTRTQVSGDNQPLISLVVPCFNTPNRYMRELVDSVFAQGYDKWQLVIVDASDDVLISENIVKISETDTRIKYTKTKNKGIAINTNIGIEQADGEYIAFLDHDDTLDPDALAENAKAILETGADLLYSDEDKVSDDGFVYFDPHYKPDFSISMLRCVNYITHFVVVKTEIVKKAGFIEAGFDGAQDYNFLLNVIDLTDKIVHLPKILYHWRQAVNSTASNFSNKKHITDAGVKALNNHYKRRKIRASATAIPNRPGFYKTNYDLPNEKRALVIDLPSLQNKKINYIIDKYTKHYDLAKDNIDIIATDLNDKKLDKYNKIVYVNKPIIPFDNKDKSLNMLFGMISSGSDMVTLKRVSKNLISDCGLVRWRGLLVPLYLYHDPQSPGYFGSPEWNREVNGLNWGIVAGELAKLRNLDKSKPITEGSLSVLGQCEYVELNEHQEVVLDKAGNNYFNGNLVFEMSPKTVGYERIIDRIELKK